jgi:recombination protein RecT
MTQLKQPNQAGIIAKKAASAERKQPETLRDWVQLMLPQIEKALPSVMTAERFTRIVTTALSSNPKLAQCTRDSFLGGMMQAAQLGLEPNTPLGQAYLIPYKNNKKGVYECQFQIGYKGLIDLAYRSGEVATIQAHCVYENDTFEYELGLDAKLRHIPAKGERGEMTHVYAVIKLANGGYAFEVMSAADVRTHAHRYSKAYEDGPWQTNFDEMAKKTVLKKVLKYAPLKSDFARGIVADEGTLRANVQDDYVEVAYTINEDEQDVPETVDPATGEVLEEQATIS